MKRQFKSVISVLLCFVLIFGQLTPMTVSTASINPGEALKTCVTDGVYQDTADTQQVNFAPESITNPVIFGEISLPDGYTAPAGGVSISIFASNNTSSHSTAVSIAAGETKASYSLNVKAQAGYALSYQTAHVNYVNQMYLGANSMVRSKSSADLFDLSEGDKNLNLTLIPMRKISGKLILPGNSYPLNFKVWAESSLDSKSSDVITMNESEAEYSIMVPPNTIGSGYIVRYEAINNNAILSPGYLGTSGIVGDKKLAATVDVSGKDKTDLNLQIVKKKIISGTLAIPEGAVLPDTNLNVIVKASFGTDSANTTVVLSRDNPVQEYKLYVPEGTGYKVEYQLSNFEQFVQKGYYNKNGTVSDIAKAEPINVMEGDRTDVNFKLIAKSSIKGIIKLPDGLKASAEGVDVTIRAYNSANNGLTNVKIKQGSDFEYFTLYVPEGMGYKLYYDTKNTNYAPKGYYNIAGMVSTDGSASTFDLVNGESKTINLSMISKKAISGKIQLPKGVSNDEEVVFKVTATSGSETGTTEVKMLQNESSVNYSLLVSPGTDYVVKCEITKGAITYIKTTYYSAARTVYESKFAEKINTTAGNQSNIDFVLLEKRKISGTLSFPKDINDERFKNGMPYDTTFYYTDEDERVYSVVFKKGTFSTEYTFYMNPGVREFFYRLGPNDTFVEEGYYSDTGTVMDEKAASPIDVTIGDAAGKNFTFILKKVISGKIKFEKDIIAVGNVSAVVKVQGARGEDSQQVTIPNGSNYAEYRLTVPPGSDYILWYENVSGSANSISKMYYNSGYMVRNKDDAGKIDVSQISRDNVDLMLSEIKLVSGELRVPEGDRLIANTAARIYAENKENPNDFIYTDVVIPANSPSVPYNIYVPNGNSYYIRYTLNSENNVFAKDGYLGNGEMAVNRSYARELQIIGGNTNTYNQINLTLIKKRIIKGTISLPEGVSIASNISLNIFAGSYSTPVTLRTDGNPVEYTLRVPPNAPDSGYIVYYKIGSTTTLFNETGYYSSSGMVSDPSNGDLIDVSTKDRDDLNLSLIPKSSISGAVKLPAENFASKETPVRVYVSNSTYTRYQDVLIKEGTNSAPYIIYIPAGTGYTVRYEINNSAYAKNGYYSDAGTVKDQASATKINLGNENRSGVNLTLIGNSKIEGTLTLPGNRVAPANGLKVKVIATLGTTTTYVNVTMPQNSKSAAYSIYVSPASNYKVSYQITEDKSYMSEGFYNKEATTLDINNASLVDASKSVSDINMTLLSKIAISGVVSIPASSDPKADLMLRIYAVSGSNSGDTEVLIPNNTKQVPYTVYVPAIGSYEVRYEISSNNMYVTPGYYNNQATTSDKAAAFLVKVSGDVSYIDMTIIPKRIISGTVFLKNEFAPLRGLPVEVSVSYKKITDTTKTLTSTVKVVIPEGSSSVPYTIYVIDGIDYVVNYIISDVKYIDKGYYTSKETIRNAEKAEKIDLTSGSSVGVNLTLIRKKEISGTISLTKGTAPYGGLDVIVFADNDNKDSGNTKIIIPEGISSVPYTVYVPEGANYKIGYKLDENKNNASYVNNEKFLYPAYYKAGGSVRYIGDSEFLNLTAENKTGVNINIIPKYFISGTVNLPKGTVVPTGGIRVDISAYNGSETIAKAFTILEGSEGVNYKIFVPPGYFYKVKYDISNTDYLPGYYNVSGTVDSDSDASYLPRMEDDISDINMEIIEKKTISGKISLPDDVAPSGPVTVKIYAGKTSVTVSIPKGNRDATYSIKVPPNKPQSGYLVYYELTTSNEEFIKKGYYALNGGFKNTVPFESNADLVDVSSESNLHVDVMILKRIKISGNIKTPVSLPAPNGGISVDVSVEGTSIVKNFTIPENSSYVPFALYVDPILSNSGYKIKYTVKTANTGYALNAYFNYDRPVLNVNDASYVKVGTGDQVIDLILIGNSEISGTVELLEKAPVNGINVTVYASNNTYSAAAKVFIAPGETKVPYFLGVPPAPGYKVYYTIEGINKYAPKGYYSTTGTVVLESSANLLSTLNGDKTAIKLVPILNRKISGTISLPVGYSPSGTVSVKLAAGTTVGNDTYLNAVMKNLTASSSSASYEIYLPPVANYKLYYEVNNADLVGKGYFSTTGTILDSNKAYGIDLSKADYTANLSLISNREVKGVISIAGTAPAGGMDVKLFASNRTYTNSVTVKIAEGNSHADYSIKIPPASGYVVWYEVPATGDYFPKGYYKKGGLDAVKAEGDAYRLDLTSINADNTNFRLLNYYSISGRVILSSGAAPFGGVQFTLTAKNSKNTRTLNLTIPEGSNETKFTLYVPDGNGYKLFYSMPVNDNYAEKAYYGQSTVLDESDAIPFDVYENKTKDINIIVKRVISGTIKLPKDEAASRDMYIDLIASMGRYEFKKTVKINKGENSASYSMKVLPNQRDIYKLRFETSFDYGYVRSGYFNESGFVRNIINAKAIDVNSGDFNRADFDLRHLVSVSGKVRLKSGAAPAQGLKVDVLARNKADSASTTVIIPGGSTEGDYILFLPSNDKGDDYSLRYENWENDSYLSTGFYSNLGTVRYENLEDKLDISDKTSGVDLEIEKKKIVSGKISLPIGETAPEGGLKITIIARNAFDSGRTVVFIPAGSDKADYSLNIPSGREYQLYYELPIINDYVMNGYYREGSMVYKPLDADKMDFSTIVDEYNNKHLTLIKKKVISGKISLPLSETASEEIVVKITAENAGNTLVRIPAGSNSVSYIIKAAPSIEGKGCKVGYEVSSIYGFVVSEYYSKNGMVRNSKLAYDVNANDKDEPGIDLELVRPRKINGKVSLPNGVEAEGKDIKIKITGSNGIDSISANVVIPAGESSADYSLELPPNDRGYGYIVKYENWGEYKYTLYGYYSSKGTTAILSEAESVDINTNDAANKDMTLVVRRTIKGNIIVPEGAVIPAEGLRLNIIAERGLEIYTTNVVLSQDTRTCPFVLYVEQGSGYKLRYELGGESIFIEKGFYSSEGTTTIIDNAESLRVSDSELTNKDITLLIKRVISGTITLPDSADHASGISVIASDGRGTYSTVVSIAKGNRSVEYLLNVPAGNNYTVRYEVVSNPEIAPVGYYSSLPNKEEAVRDIKDAKVFDLSLSGADGINFKMLQNRTISGKIKLQEGIAGPDGVKVFITATDISGRLYLKEFYIPAGKRSIDYTLSVMPVKGYKVKYNVELPDYYSFGYYNSQGMVMLAELAKEIDVSSQVAEDIDITLICKKEIKGTLSLPVGTILSSGDLDVKVKAVNVKTGFVDTADAKIVKGSSMAEYSIKVTPDVSNSQYKVYYETDSYTGVFEKGYYNSAVTVPDEKLASTLDLTNGSFVDVNLGMIKSRTISGKLKLPEEVNAGTEDIKVNVYAEKVKYTGYRVVKTITIPRGQKYAEFELSVPESTTTAGRINVQTRTNGMSSSAKVFSAETKTFILLANNNNSDYVVGFEHNSSSLMIDGLYQSGFYTVGGTTADFTKAGALNVANGDINGIDLVVKKKERKITGIFKLPVNAAIPRNGFNVKIMALNSSLGYTPETSFTVYPGQNNVEFELSAPAMDKYHVKYSTSLDGYMESGFYSSKSTKGKEIFADDVNTLNANVNNIVLELISGIEVSGTIKLPNNMKVEYDSFGVLVKAENESNEYSVYVPMARNSQTAGYKLYLPTGRDYLISYSILPLFGEYLSKSYYRYDGATTEINIASRLEVKSATVIDDIALIPSNRVISGSVSLPDGTGDTAFSLNVPANEMNSGYNVSYSLERRDDYPNNFSNGYYSKGGTVNYIGDAYAVDVNSKNANNIKMPLLAEGTIAVEAIVMNKHQVSMTEGSIVNLGVQFYPQYATNKSITWSSDNTNVAKVSSDGTVKALSPGEAVIKAKSGNDIEVSCRIAVTEEKSTGFNLDKNEVYIVPGDKLQLNAIFGADVEVSSVIWSSDDSSIAYVSDGEVKGMHPGEATITATYEDNPILNASCIVHVINPVSRIQIREAPKVSINAGSTKQLTAVIEPDDEMTKGVTWSSSDTKVADIDQNGVVTGVKKGTALITVKSKYNVSIKATCTVEVRPVPVRDIRFNVSSIEMLHKSTFTFYATMLPYEAEDKTVSVEVSNSSALKVIENVLAQGSGENKITIEAIGNTVPVNPVTVTVRSKENNSISKAIEVTIKKIPVTSLSWATKPATEVKVGKSFDLEVNASPNNATNRNNITWSTSDASNKYIELNPTNNKCTIKGKAVTSSPVTVMASVDGYSLSCQVKVLAADVDAPGPGGSLPGGASPTPTIRPTPTPTLRPTATPTARPTVTPTPTKKPSPTPIVIAPTKNVPGVPGINDYKDIAKHWAKDSFSLLLSKGIISGYPDKTLRPNAEITREEISKIIIIAAGYTPANNSSLPYKDSSSISAWAKPFIKSAMESGIIKGYENNTFRPKNKLTRKEMAVLIINAFGYDISQNPKINMKDANKIPAWAKGYVAKAIELGIIKGYNDNTFRPDKTITRAEVAAMIARCISQ
ncbi:MAG TPA: S-layer homology domain-containing protein [Pseudobacteroides sp.]|uniref:S-layer homology domain-containing protein n=1 Tax=Pseudobacteroides sp. TaxID=1968840 RepID=UPI002F93CA89